MYCKFFGFSEKPFDVTPDPKFLYLTKGHREMLATLLYGINERRGFIAIMGEAGTGKTTLLDIVKHKLNEKTKVAYISNTVVSYDQLLAMALAELGLANPEEVPSRVASLNRLGNFASRQLLQGGNVALIVDEAQNLDFRDLEGLRLLSNLETSKHKLIQIVLSGQPELHAKLRRPEMRQLAQRINMRRYLAPLTERETQNYIRHRLIIAKYRGPVLFSPGARDLIWKYAGGIPRLINVVCDNALLIAFALQRKTIGVNVVQEAIDDLRGSPFAMVKKSQKPPPVRRPQHAVRTDRFRWARAAGFVIAFSILVVLGLFVGYARFDLRIPGLPLKQPSTRTQLTSSIEIPPQEAPDNVSLTSSAQAAVAAEEGAKEEVEIKPVDTSSSSQPSEERSTGAAVYAAEKAVATPEDNQESATLQSPEISSPRQDLEEQATGAIRQSTRTVVREKNLVIQVGAFQKFSSAEALLNRLQEKGYDAYIDGRMSTGVGLLYTVRLRGYSESTAKEVIAKLAREIGITDSFILRVDETGGGRRES